MASLSVLNRKFGLSPRPRRMHVSRVLAAELVEVCGGAPGSHGQSCSGPLCPHPYLQLAVPLQVDAEAAQNWDEAH
jgi:hypothetical protein